ncbi:Imm32 family immunity protein [Paenibacillus ferrarius]|uniref:Imm32 family immunity protein n=1 Tax=Paenibacillus ferrarius TaxID=1469647 RepID=UPI003D2B92D6
MKLEIDIPEYDPAKGLKVIWENNFEIKAIKMGDDFVIEANKEGLISLAKQMLSIAYNDLFSGFHIHYEESTCLEKGSASFVIELK